MPGATYRLYLAEPLSDSWAEWFAPLELERSATGGTLLMGAVVDQTALHGLLARIRDLNLTLVAVVRLDALQALEPDDVTALPSQASVASS